MRYQHLDVRHRSLDIVFRQPQVEFTVVPHGEFFYSLIGVEAFVYFLLVLICLN
jgi:hypothetical protein